VIISSSNGSVQRGDSGSATITAKNITLSAANGVGASAPIIISLRGGALNADTDYGIINVSAKGAMTTGQIDNTNGEIRLYADTNIEALNGSSLIKGYH
jgi:hypothetical protein